MEKMAARRSGWRDPILPHIAVNEEEYPLHDWKIARFGQDYSSNPDASNRADPNGSGLANLLEYAFDRHPGEAALEDPAGFARPRLYRSMAGEDHFVGLMYRKNQDAVDLRYEVEISPNLEPSSWSLIEWAEPEEQVGTEPVSGTPVYRQLGSEPSHGSGSCGWKVKAGNQNGCRRFPRTPVMDEESGWDDQKV